MHHERADKVLSGTAAEQVAEAVALLAERGALRPCRDPTPVNAAERPRSSRRSAATA